MRRDMLEPVSFAAGLDNIPDDILRDPLAPDFAGASNGTKDSSFGDIACLGPVVEGGLHPPPHRNRTDVTALADQVHDRPVPLPHLQVIEPLANQFRTAEAAAEQHGQHGVVSLST